MIFLIISCVFTIFHQNLAAQKSSVIAHRLQVTSWQPMPMLSRAAKEMHKPSLPGHVDTAR